jgi:hypothetical protein
MRRVVAIGKWSKEDKDWKMVLALRPPNGNSPATSAPSGRHNALRAKPRKRPSK